MVNQITSNITQLRRVGDADMAQTGRTRPDAAGQADRPRGAGDQVALSSDALSLPADMQAGPPIDQALVARLGQDIAAGRYPLNPEKIAQALIAQFAD
jgi:negative regulator of flagellin synthesis FlgM